MDLIDAEWSDYIDTLRMTRTCSSGYTVIHASSESRPGTPIDSTDMTDVTLYQLFVWLHHYAAKNNECEEGGEVHSVTMLHHRTGLIESLGVS